MYMSLELEEFNEQEIICNYGDYGDKFYIILQGQLGVRVPVNETK